LHERKEDIKGLVLENQPLLRGKQIGKGFWDVVCNYHWPGNVRELLNILKRAGIMLEGPITGEKMTTLLDNNGKKNGWKTNGNGHGDLDSALKEIRKKLKTNGGSFWQLIWKPFIDRDFDRRTVKGILKFFYIESSYNFRKMTRCLNVDESEYPKLMSLIYKYRIDPRK
jgi:transcriptional regulator with GAF, ATPase, and Fis domain